MTFLEQPGLGHSFVSETWLGRALDFLDGPLPQIANVRFKIAKKAHRKQPGLALRYYQAASLHSKDSKVAEEAKSQMLKLSEDYQVALEKMQAKVEKAKPKAAYKLLEKLAVKWGELSAADVTAMRDEIKARDP